MTHTVLQLLDLARTDPDVRPILADALQDADGETPAVAAARRWRCEKCDCPDTKESVCWDLEGRWHFSDDVLACSIEHWARLFGENDDPRHETGTLTLYPFGRWHLVCPHCKRKLVAQKAHATRRASHTAEQDASGLFAGLE